MATGNRKVDIYLKKFLTQQQITENFFDFLEKKTNDVFTKLFPVNGVFEPNILVSNILSASAPDTFDISSPLRGTDGSQGNYLILDPIDANLISFENAFSIPYYVGLRFNYLPRETEINVRTGEIKYTFKEESVGEVADPNSVNDDGDETLTLIIDSVCEPGVSHAGRKAIVWLKRAQNQAQAFEELTVIWDGVNNKIETVTALGQTLGNISTDPSDYQVFLKGPTIRRNTDLRLDNNILFLGIVTGAGPGNTPSSFDETDVNNHAVSFPSLVSLFFEEHSSVDGTHTLITPERISTKQIVPGVQLDTQVNAADEDSPDVPVSHTLFQSSGGSGIQGIKWRLRNAMGNPIAFVDAHGNAYFQSIAAVSSIFRSTIVVEGDQNIKGSSTLGDDINIDVVTLNAKLQSMTDMIFLIDSDNNGTGHGYQFYNNSVGPLNEIFRILESGNLWLFGSILAKNPVFNIDLDTDNLATGETFRITKNGGLQTLFELLENGNLNLFGTSISLPASLLSIDLDTDNNDPGESFKITRHGGQILTEVNEFGDHKAARDQLTALGTVYKKADTTPINVNSSLNEAYDETLSRKLLKVRPNNPNNFAVIIDPAQILAADASKFALTNNGEVVVYAGGTVNFATGVVTGGGANFTPYTPTAPNRFFKYGLTLDDNNELVVVLPTNDGATEGAANDPDLGDNLPIGILVVRDNGAGGAGTILAISESNIVRFGAKGGGSATPVVSGGGGAPIEPEDGFEAAVTDDLTTPPADPTSKVNDPLTNANHDTEGAYRLQCDKSKTASVTIINQVNEVQRLIFSQVPTGGFYRLSHDGNETTNIPAGTNAAGLIGFLEALSSIDSSSLNIVGSEAAGFDITFGTTEGGINQPQLVVSLNTLVRTVPDPFNNNELLRCDFTGVGVLLEALISKGDERFFFLGGGNITANPGKLSTTSGSSGGTRIQAFTAGPDGNINPRVGTIRFKWIPNAAGGFQVLFEAREPAAENALTLQRQPSGALTYQAFDSVGFTNINSNFGIPSVTPGVECEVEFSYDFVSGAQRLFVNGVQVGATHTGTISRSASYTVSANFVLGSDGNGNFSGNFQFDDLQIFKTIQHTTNFAGEIPRVLSTVDETFRDTFVNASTNADFAAGAPARSLTGGATISSNRLVVPGGGGRALYANFGQGLNDDIGTIRFKWTPDFSGPPGTNKSWFGAKDTGNQSEITLKLLATTGIVQVTSVDSSNNIFNTNFGNFPTIVNGQTYEIEFDYDYVTNVQRFFVNGLLIGSAAVNLTSDQNFLFFNSTMSLGSKHDATESMSGAYDDLQLFRTVKHTANFPAEVPRVPGQDVVTPSVSTLTDGVPGDHKITPSGVPSFTLQVGDIVYWPGVVRTVNQTVQNGGDDLNNTTQRGIAGDFNFTGQKINKIVIKGFRDGNPVGNVIVKLVHSISGLPSTNPLDVISTMTIPASSFGLGVTAFSLNVQNQALSGLKFLVFEADATYISGFVSGNVIRILRDSSGSGQGRYIYNGSVWSLADSTSVLFYELFEQVTAPEFRRITIIQGPTDYVIDTPFSQVFTVAPIMFSQAVWTKDLVNLGDPTGLLDNLPFSKIFGPRDLLEAVVRYEDSLAAGDMFPDLDQTARIAVAGSSSGLVTDLNQPLSSTFSQAVERPLASGTLPKVVFPTSTNNERCFFVFFCSPTNDVVSTAANLLNYKASIYEIEGFNNGGYIDSGFIISDGTNANGILGISTVFDVPLGQNVSEVELGFSFIPNLNLGKPNGDLTVIVEGLEVPRYYAGLDPAKTLFYREVGTNRIRFSEDLTTSVVSIHALRRQGTLDTKDQNALRIAAFADVIVGSALDVANGKADFSSIQQAHDFLSTPGKILLLATTVVGAVVWTKSQLFLEGKGNGSVLNGALTVNGNANLFKNLKVTGNVIFNGNKNRANDNWITAASTVTNNGTDNQYSFTDD